MTHDSKPGSQKPFLPTLDLQSFSYDDRANVLPDVLGALADCGGWVLDRRTLSASAVEFRVEVQLRSIVDLYGSIIAAGLELTRASPLALTDQCNCRKNAATVADLGQILTLRLEISFIEDLTLHSLLSAGSAPA
ncbi:hypothetical protein [Edaphobacter aggregans]|uniref:hypothetical protein n=1 Tax=Edaphobacter aggregans TaxID=570835 RepID=UPI001FE055AA|nr:hypothetical protein [Edaphobacter aggregans]